MDQYFATLPLKEIGNELIAKKEQYFRYLESSGHLSLLRNSFYHYFKPSLSKGHLYKSGQQNEYTNISVNHYRNLIQHMLTLTTTQRPHFEPKATNTDHKSQVQAQLASGLLEYYQRVKKMDRYLKMATELCLVYGEGFVYTGWDPSAGDSQTRNPTTGGLLKEGDVEFEAFGPIDVIRDISKEETQPHSWMMLRKFENKYDLMANYTELAEKLSHLSGMVDRHERINIVESFEKNQVTDNVPIYYFFHEKTPALPEGRIVILADSDIILHDGPLPYRELPVYRIAAAEKTGSIFGYSNSWDCMPLQEALDKLYSTVITNQSSFGVQNILLPKGSDINVSQLSGGLNVIEYDERGGKPEALQLTATPPEVFSMIELLKNDQQLISAINSVVRGEPESSLKSGSALALVQSTAIQFSQSLQQSYANLLEDIGTSVINLLRDYASVPRIALIAGKSNRSNMKEFKGDDLNLINRVIVDMGNPLMRTTAGRVNIAEQLIQLNMIKSPEQYLEVLTTGRLEPIYEGELAELNLIRMENEKLAEGSQDIIALSTDSHNLHILEHGSVLASPESRFNPEIVEATLYHISEHQSFIAPPQMDPTIAQDAMGAIPEQMNPASPVEQQAADVNLPNLPVDPTTGEQP